MAGGRGVGEVSSQRRFVILLFCRWVGGWLAARLRSLRHCRALALLLMILAPFPLDAADAGVVFIIDGLLLVALWGHYATDLIASFSIFKKKK